MLLVSSEWHGGRCQSQPNTNCSLTSRIRWGLIGRSPRSRFRKAEEGCSWRWWAWCLRSPRSCFQKKKKKTSFQDLNLRKRSRTRGKTTWMKYWNVFGRLLKIGCGLLPSESYQSVPLVRGALVFKPLLLQPRQLQLLFLQLWPWLPTQTTSTFAFSWWDYYCTTALVYTTAFFFWQGNLKTH